jgi:hypothetical protein
LQKANSFHDSKRPANDDPALYPNGDITNYVVLTFYCPLDQKESRSIVATSMRNRAKYSFAKPEAVPFRRSFSCSGRWSRYFERYQKKEFRRGDLRGCSEKKTLTDQLKVNFDLVERKRIELSTSSMPWRRSPS